MELASSKMCAAFSTASSAGHRLDVRASFCFEKCEHGPNAKIDGDLVSRCTPEKAIEALHGKSDCESKCKRHGTNPEDGESE